MAAIMKTKCKVIVHHIHMTDLFLPKTNDAGGWLDRSDDNQVQKSSSMNNHKLKLAEIKCVNYE